MRTIQIKDLEYTYGSHYKPIFKDVNLQLDAQWKLGLIGRNGRGKTTLLKLLHGILAPDKGSIVNPLHTEMFPYEYSKTHSTTMNLIKDNVGPYFQLESEMEKLLAEDTEASYTRYSEVITLYNDLNGYEIEAMIEREFNLMELPLELLDRPFETLSGGEKTKALIIALFLRKNYFLLLDESTNHLDVEGKRTLSKYLKRKTGFIIVSHDRKFLDTVVDHILSINKGSIEIEKGTFSSWDQNRKMKEIFERRKKERIEKEVKNLEKSAKESRRFSNSKEKEKIGSSDKGFVGARAARLMKRAKNIERRQEKQLEEKKSLLKDLEEIPKLTIKQQCFKGKELLKVQSLTFSYGERSLIKELSFVLEAGDCLWIRGTNGTGKSTLLNIIRGRVKGYSGYIKKHSELIIAESYQDALWTEGYLIDKIMKEKIDRSIFQTTLSYFDMYEEYFERPLETFSQGELKKIDIARALSMENQLIILDEPLNYMDIFFREQLEKAILHYKPTMIFVEHDEHFGEVVATKLLEL